MSTRDAFFGPNAAYVLELYERYQRDPTAVDPTTRAFFARSAPPVDAVDAVDGATRPITSPEGVHPYAPTEATDALGVGAAGAISGRDIARIVAAARLARGIREYGHLGAHIDPLGGAPPGDPMLDPTTHGLSDADLASLPASIVWPEAGPESGSCLAAIATLRGIYSGPLGYDFDHVQDFDERAWLRESVESGVYRAPLDAEARRALLRRLSAVESFERFLHTTFQGQKRFSIEGTDLLVPMLDTLIHDAARAGTREVLLGMAHRGRLNVLAHILEKPYARIFSEFHHAPNKELVPSEGSMGINYGWTGDVKYHLGARATVTEDNLVTVRLTLADNPSHLEFVNPVVEGFTRAAQERRDQPGTPQQNTDRALAVTIHGDAAFPGEGVVAETLNLSRLPGYQTGGTVHLIVNNQIGFTTGARDGRSTLYASDLAKGFEIPIIHVNADDPEACLAATRIAHAYRQRFHKDFLVDLVGYRRWGHNEGDEPSFTQPVLYAAIGAHPTARALYAGRLAADGVVPVAAADALLSEAQARLKAAYDEVTAGHIAPEQAALEAAPPLATANTAVPAERLRALNEALLARPDGFTPHPRLERQLARRREAIERAGGIDWGQAESLAFASILADGTPIRLTGQDSERGTFSHRHLVLHDPQTGATYQPLQALPQARAACAIYNSPLSEAAALGFEYGYSVHAPETLTLWEAQFGDFANAGQVIIDQFIAAARAKWRQHPALVLLLPHGYEGQGPEHSSARVERYLQLAAEDNLRIVNCTTAAQYFHLLRAQAASLPSLALPGARRGGEGTAPRPLVVLMPKSLLRHPRAGSSLDELSHGHFQPVLNDPTLVNRRTAVERLILCSGKIAVELAVEREASVEADSGRDQPVGRVAVVRIEQLYPLPVTEIEAVIGRYPGLREIVWLQEEPRNMGAWSYMAPRLRPLLPEHVSMNYIGRPERASTAEGLADAHTLEQARIVHAAFAEVGART
ncbi:MAG TPA: 2-oxoglutarate dehydrogenase E1 component [Ktedonobacterales bacterium]|nr:2-oxoglutarate dehydrogenase E1 component [Ktedonobacterales bacterium]